MKNVRITFLLYMTTVMFWSCKENSKTVVLDVKNPLDMERKEIVSIGYDAIKDVLNNKDQSGVLLQEKGSDQYQVIQWVDNNSDGQPDELLFQAHLGPGETKQYELTWKVNAEQPEPELTTYSRFVPERTDDYTWENDKVAFRTYGPEAQRLAEEKLPGGTLSSGIDLWLKRVEHPVIDKWYAENVKSEGYYHIDHGEGYDPYHVGKSRGTGGIGVWKADTLLTSKNFIAYRTIAKGPLRTVFELDYAPWSEFGVKETKRVSLDLGSNFSMFEITLSSEKPVPNYTIGITLHDGKGETKLDTVHGWFRHWEPIDEAHIGEGIVLDPAQISNAFVHRSKTPDQSQLLIATHPKNKLTYYAGFAWTKSGQTNSKEDWDALLAKQAKIVADPLEVTIVDR